MVSHHRQCATRSFKSSHNGSQAAQLPSRCPTACVGISSARNPSACMPERIHLLAALSHNPRSILAIEGFKMPGRCNRSFHGWVVRRTITRGWRAQLHRHRLKKVGYAVKVPVAYLKGCWLQGGVQGRAELLPHLISGASWEIASTLAHQFDQGSSLSLAHHRTCIKHVILFNHC